jgi:hypothetical protein
MCFIILIYYEKIKKNRAFLMFDSRFLTANRAQGVCLRVLELSYELAAA